MTRLRHEIRIEAPVAVVWQAVAGDLCAVQEYNPGVSSARLLTEQRQGVGAARRCELRPNGFVEERVWEWDPPRAVGIEVSTSAWPVAFMRWRTELAEEGTATLVRQELHYQPKLGPLGAVLDALVMRRRLDRAVREVFASLKRYVEVRAAR